MRQDSVDIQCSLTSAPGRHNAKVQTAKCELVCTLASADGAAVLGCASARALVKAPAAVVPLPSIDGGAVGAGVAGAGVVLTPAAWGWFAMVTAAPLLPKAAQEPVPVGVLSEAWIPWACSRLRTAPCTRPARVRGTQSAKLSEAKLTSC